MLYNGYQMFCKSYKSFFCVYLNFFITLQRIKKKVDNEAF